MNRTAAKLSLLISIVVFALVLIYGCGGGGGGGGTTGTTGGTQGVVVITLPQNNLAYAQTITITASVPGQADQTVIFSADGGTISQTGPNTAVYTAPSTTGTYHIRAVSDASSSIVGSVAISVSGTSISISPTSAFLKPGQSAQFSANVQGTTNKNVTFTATGGTITQTGAATATYKAGSVSGNFSITATAASSQKATAQIVISANGGGTAIVTGKVFDNAGNALSGVVVQFYNAQGTQVAQVTTSNGAFNAAVPVSATTFSLLPTSVNTNTEYESFAYNLKRYAPLISTCRAALPALVSGQSQALPYTIYIDSRQSPPPPPPDGCSG